MKYDKVLTKTNIRRSFRIVCGLREGYKQDAVVHKPEEAIDVVHEWMKQRAERGVPFLTGSFSNETLVYTWKGATDDADAPEPSIAYQGEISIAYNPGMSDEEAQALLAEIAALLGERLRQTRVYVSYRDEIWILQAEGKFSPRVAEEQLA